MVPMNFSFSLKGKLMSRPWRWAKTIFFLVSMVASLLLVSASPVLVVLVDVFLPPALLSAATASPITVAAMSKQLKSFDFGASLVDVVLVSVVRSAIILCAYLGCEGYQRLYPVVTTVCGFGSIGYVFVKIVGMCAMGSLRGERWLDVENGGGIEALFFSSVALAIAHMVVSYRTCCRERRKLLVYRIDIEAVKLKGGQIKGETIF